MKVVRVKFKETGEEYYFTSYSGIYDRFTRDEIGAVIGSIWNKVSKNGGYENSKVRINSYPLLTRQRKTTN